MVECPFLPEPNCLHHESMAALLETLRKLVSVLEAQRKMVVRLLALEIVILVLVVLQ